VKIVDKNHTGLSPCGITVIRGFVLTSDQVHPQGSMIIGLRIGTYFSHGFGIYSHVFGAIRPSSGSPSTTRGTLCVGYIDSCTWYSSYTIHVGISIPMVATHRLHPSYGSYAPATPFLRYLHTAYAITTNATLPRPITAC